MEYIVRKRSWLVRLVNRQIKTEFIILPEAQNNQMLLGIDFMKKAGIGLLARKEKWFFEDKPHKLYQLEKEQGQNLQLKRTEQNTDDKRIKVLSYEDES